MLVYILIPSVKLLMFSDDINEYKLSNIESYKPNKAIVKKVKLESSETENINYDKDVFKYVYLYTIENLKSKQIDSLYEKAKKNTYFFSQIKPSYKVNDTILYFKNDNENITEMEYLFMTKYKDKKPILWFSIVLLVLSISIIFLLLKPLIKNEHQNSYSRR